MWKVKECHNKVNKTQVLDLNTISKIRNLHKGLKQTIDPLILEIQGIKEMVIILRITIKGNKTIDRIRIKIRGSILKKNLKLRLALMAKKR